MSFSSAPFSAVPFSSGMMLSHPTLLASSLGEYGWAAWTYSKTAKLNAWAWHGLGSTGTANINAWAQLAGSMYLRRDGDEALYFLTPDVYFENAETNAESSSVYAETQWMDFGKPGSLKSLTGIDFDGVNIVSVLVYVSVDGDRVGQLADTILVGSAQDGWTYSGDTLPVNAAGTEFRLRFVGDPDLETQINRLTVYWDDLGAT
jgi:hypothetical protein